MYPSLNSGDGLAGKSPNISRYVILARKRYAQRSDCGIGYRRAWKWGGAAAAVKIVDYPQPCPAPTRRRQASSAPERTDDRGCFVLFYRSRTRGENLTGLFKTSRQVIETREPGYGAATGANPLFAHGERGTRSREHDQPAWEDHQLNRTGLSDGCLVPTSLPADHSLGLINWAIAVRRPCIGISAQTE